MENLHLLSDRIIARLITPDTSPGGVVLPACAGNTDTHRLADVIHVGQDVMDVKPFDRVMLNFQGGWVKLEDEHLILCHEKDVLALVEVGNV